nr:MULTISPECIES: AAA family ATPase [unclassified Coleofasciculus]
MSFVSYGTCANFPITDELLRTLADMRSDGNILPFPLLTVGKRIISGCELAVAIVEPSDAPPVRFNGRTWIRVGPRRATATPEEERRLNEKRRSKDLPDELSAQWPGCLDRKERSFRIISAFWRLLDRAAKNTIADVVLVDLGPNLGAINRAALIASDYVVVPLSPDLFSL